MSWWSKNITNKIGAVLGSILMPGIGTALGSAYDSRKKAVQEQAAIAERTAIQQAEYYNQQQAKAQEEEQKASTAAAATTNAMKRGLSPFLFNNNLLGVSGGKKQKLN